jgi:hypothetical protein
VNATEHNRTRVNATEHSERSLTLSITRSVQCSVTPLKNPPFEHNTRIEGVCVLRVKDWRKRLSPSIGNLQIEERTVIRQGTGGATHSRLTHKNFRGRHTNNLRPHSSIAGGRETKSIAESVTYQPESALCTRVCTREGPHSRPSEPHCVVAKYEDLYVR